MPVLLLLAALMPSADEQPNIVVILADDLGSGDVRPLNPESPIPTPGFDQLAVDGMTFTNAHTSAAVCTPTRYALLTGRHCWRTGLKKGVLGGYSRPLIEDDRETVAQVAKRAGYRTAVIGKWHLGLGWTLKNDVDNLDDFSKPNAIGKVDFTQPLTASPNSLGFDHSFLVSASLDMSPYVYIADGRVTEQPTQSKPAIPFPAFSRAGEQAPGFVIKDVLDTLTEQAAGFIEDAAGHSTEPFFLYLPLTSPHKPIATHPRFKGRSGIGPYGDFVAQTDDVIVRVRDALKNAGVADDTLVIVTSDNGSYMRLTEKTGHRDDPTVQAYRPQTHRPNAGYRGTKADLYEAGHRVPFFAVWPGHIEPGARIDEPVTQVDLLATVADLLGESFDAASAEDSVSMLPLFRGEARDRRPIVVQSANGSLGLIHGTMKYLATDGSGGRERPAGRPWKTPHQLYDLDADPGETNNLIDERPEIARSMLETLRAIEDGDAVR